MLHVMAELDPMVYLMVVVVAIAFGVGGLVLIDLFNAAPPADTPEANVPPIADTPESNTLLTADTPEPLERGEATDQEQAFTQPANARR
jgi:hypothetical protein